MYRFIQRNNKKFLAIFAVVLMIVFILPSSLGQLGSGGRDPVLAKIGDEEVHASELQSAEQEWRLLNELRAGGPQTRFGSQLPFVFRLGWNEMSELELMQGMPPVPVRAITGNPRLFLLLQREAQRLGIGISDDRVNDLMVNELAGALPADKQSLDRLRGAVRSFLAVQTAFERATSVIKLSDPALKHELARRTQNITVNVVEVPAAAYAGQLPAPTTQQVQAQFDKFKDVNPQSDPRTNPFGFGYRYPNRVKLQYISVSRDDVRKMVEASRSGYEWEVEAQKYYLQNQSQFPTTQKSAVEETPFILAGPATTSTTTASTTSPATNPAAGNATTQTAATVSSTTRPFAEVKDDAKGRIIVPEVERKITEIRNRITAIMAADFQTFRNAAGSATQPATATASSQNAPYNSYAYLQNLAQTIQREFKVLPTVAAFDDVLRDAEALAVLERIGTATDAESNQPFAEYVTTAAAPFLPADRRDDANALAVYAPSRPLRDLANNVYVFRLTAADPAHAPATLAEVGDAVRADVNAAASFERVKTEAAKLLEQAKQSGLQQVGPTSQRSVLTVGPFPADVRGKLPGLDLMDETSSATFAEGAFKLLSTTAPRDGAKPVALIEVPKEGKVYVAELADVQPRQQMTAMGGAPESEIERGMLAELERLFEMQWFNFDNAAGRMNYAATDAPREDRQPQTPRAPLPRPLPM